MFFRLSNGIALEQNKEPALGRELREFCNEVTKVTLIDKTEIPQGELTPENIILFAKAAAIVDESDGRKLYTKLNSHKKLGTQKIVIDAIDDEPYISSQLNPALNLSEKMAIGLEYAKKAIGATEAVLAVCGNIFDEETKIPKDVLGIPVEKMSSRYPAEYLGKRRFNKEKSLVIGSCALIHLARAVEEHRMQTTAFVTIAGDCITSPSNVEVSVGTSVQAALDFCGLIQNPSRVVTGGSMTGSIVTNTVTAKVNATTRGILAFKEDFKDLGYTCIGCGKCSAVCPQGLNPYYINKFLNSGNMKMLDIFDIKACIGCGTCSYICPAKLDLSKTIVEARGKMLLAKSITDVTVRNMEEDKN